MYLSIYAEEQQVTKCWISIILSSCYTFLKTHLINSTQKFLLDTLASIFENPYLLFLNVEEKIATIVDCEAATLRFTY